MESRQNRDALPEWNSGPPPNHVGSTTSAVGENIPSRFWVWFPEWEKNNKHVEQEKEERIRGEGGGGIEGETEGGRHHWYLTLIKKTRIWCTSLSMWSDCLNIGGENSCFLIYIAQRYFQAVSRLCLQFLPPLWSALFPSLCHNLHLNSRVLLDNPLNVDPTSVQADSHCPFTM